MKVDFKNAAFRHYRDGELLYQNQRWANADQLYGLSAECILKSIIVALDPNSVDIIKGDFTNTKHKKHFDNENSSKDLRNYFSINFSGRLAQRNANFPTNNGFNNWDIFQRYVQDQCIDEQRTENHRVATQTLQELFDNLFSANIIQ